MFMSSLFAAFSSGPRPFRFFFGSCGKIFAKPPPFLLFQFAVIELRGWNFGLLLVYKTQIWVFEHFLSIGYQRPIGIFLPLNSLIICREKAIVVHLFGVVRVLSDQVIKYREILSNAPLFFMYRRTRYFVSLKQNRASHWFKFLHSVVDLKINFVFSTLFGGLFLILRWLKLVLLLLALAKTRLFAQKNFWADLWLVHSVEATH